MPEPGFKSISIHEEVYDRLHKLAKDSKRSIAKYVEYLIDEYNKPQKEAA